MDSNDNNIAIDVLFILAQNKFPEATKCTSLCRAFRGETQFWNPLVKMRGTSGATVLMNTTDVSRVRWLLDRGAPLEAKNNFGRTALWLACMKGQLSVLRELIHCGASINTTDYKGWSPLHIASYVGNEAIVHDLIVAGSDINQKETLGWTPLYIACREMKLNIVRILLEKGADSRIRTNLGLTALQHATRGALGILLEHQKKNKLLVSN